VGAELRLCKSGRVTRIDERDVLSVECTRVVISYIVAVSGRKCTIRKVRLGR
jgi:hypothetical protein